MAGIWIAFAAGILCAEEPGKPQSSPAPKSELSVLTAFYQADFEEISKDYEKGFTALQSWYLAGLEKLLADRTKAGDLDGALAVKAERERIAVRTEPTAQQIQAMPPLLSKLRALYEPARKKIDDEAARRKHAARVKYVANLDALQKQFTMKADLDQAVLVRNEKDHINAQIAQEAPPAISAPATPVASVAQKTPAPATPRLTDNKRESLETTDLSNPQRNLLAPELQGRWQTLHGTWNVENGVLIGEGDSGRQYRHPLFPPFTLKFKINVRDGTRPRVRFGPFTFANEGYETTFGLYPNPDKKLFHYERNKEYSVAVEVTRQDVTLKVDGEVVATHLGVKDKIEKIEFSAGDDWSKGRVEYRDISITK